jgi:serine/threonine-protein kinase
MDSGHTSRDEISSPTALLEINRICDRFEAAWRAGGRPSLEGELAWAQESSRSALLRELLATELECRRSAGEHPRPAEYRGRFPDHVSIVEATFAASDDQRQQATLQPAGLADSDLQQSLDRLGGAEAPGPRAEAPVVTDWCQGAAGPRFRILRLHDRGGLGEVFVAKDVELSREVAYKQIRSEHAAHPQSRTRFLLEAEITGGLEHPGIVPVYGLGVDDEGRPYYAMRFIKGESLKEAIAKYHRDKGAGRDPGERMLALRGLLLRFLDVCNAVAYAHSRGVLHRDLKPGNIMLGPYGETLVVDWGLAKVIGKADLGSGPGDAALQPPSGSGLTPTVPGEACGTPAYMSPEQAAGRPEVVGPASDVYSLGATLYCLLTGRAPLEGEVGDVLNAVERGAFPPPRAQDNAIAPALEAVVLKAMALKPASRYATPRALAEDVERWLADEPVSAWREPRVVRARRWLGRHRTRVAAGVAAAVAAGLVGVAMAVFLVRTVMVVETESNRRLRAANAELLTSQAQRESAYAAEARALRRARQRFALALEAVRRQHSGASEDVLLKEPQLEGLRRSLLGSALEFYRQLQALLQEDPDPEDRAELAAAYVAVGRITSEIGSKTDALEAVRRSLELYEALAKAHPAEPKYREGWAEAQANLGDLLGEMGRRNEAVAALEQALRLWVPLEATDVAPGRLSRRMAWTHQQIGVIRTNDRPIEGLGPLLRAREIWGSQVAANPDDSRSQASLASVHHSLGHLQQAINQPEEAVRSYREGIKFTERALRSAPKSHQDENLLAKLHLGLGVVFTSLGREDEAQAACRRALEILEALVRTNPTSTSYRHSLFLACNNVGYDLSRTGQTIEASRIFQRALAVIEKLADENPSVARYATDLALLHCNIGTLHRKDGRPSEALSSFRRGLDSLSRSPALEAWDIYIQAGLLAQCGSLAVEFPGAFPDEDQAMLAGSCDMAMAALRRAIGAGFRMAARLRTDEDFAPLRARPDFQALLLDLDFPADPFVP